MVPTVGVRSPTDLVEAVVAAAAADPVVLVPHSNAGLVVPVLGELVDLRAAVFVDAALPAPESRRAGRTGLAPPALLESLRGLADPDGDLPRWTDWWSEPDLAGVLPPGPSGTSLVEQQPRLPLSYFEATLEVPAGWSRRPAAYLAYGDTYAEERAFAASAGWPVRTMPGRHLHQLHDPVGVAAAVRGLLAALG